MMASLMIVQGGVMPLLLCFLLLLVTSPVALSETPDITLAQIYRDDLDVTAYVISEKYDGVRAYWDGQQLLTRQGNALPIPDFFRWQLPAQSLDGELWFGRGEFSRAAALVQRLPDHAEYQPEWQAVRYMLFDAPQQPGGFMQRLDFLQSLADAVQRPQLLVAPQWTVASHSELQQQLQEFTEAGAEGLMLRHQQAPYRGGRSSDLIKLKAFDDAEATVLAHLPGKGKFKGMLGSVLVRLDNGRELRIGSGFTDAERLTPPPVGSRITFQYQGYTSTGLPRFARYWRPRTDE